MQNILNKIFEIAEWVDLLIKNESTGKVGDSKNSSWDEQAKVDVLSDILVEKKFMELNEIKSIVSEEKKEIIELNNSWEYLVAYDPLDWSSLIDVNLSVWSIFGIYKNDFNWKDLVGAAYISYGPRLEVVFADKNWVRFFRFIWWNFKELEINNLKDKWSIIAPWWKNIDWEDYHRNIIGDFWKKWYKIRYSGCMVLDLHQIILKWGWIFTYPEVWWKWKLRKLFEVFPFAFIFEKLSWEAIEHTWKRILENWYNSIHDTIPCYFWSKSEIDNVKKFL